MPPLIFCEVEEWKSALTRRREDLHSVDWLTEALRRFSQAHLMNRGWSTVDMSVPTRAEKVIVIHAFTWIPADHNLTHSISPCSGRRGKLDILIENGRRKRSLPLRMVFFFMVQSSERYVTK